MTSILEIESSFLQDTLPDGLLKKLEVLLKSTQNNKDYFLKHEPARYEALATRIAGIITRFMMDDSARLNHKNFLSMLSWGSVIRSVFAVSGYRGRMHILEYFLVTKSGNLDVYDIRKLFCCLDLENTSESLLEKLSGAPVDYYYPLLISLLGSHELVSEKKSQTYQAALKQLYKLDVNNVTYAHLNAICAAHTCCSYDYHEEKHRLRAVLNEHVQTFVANFDIPIDYPLELTKSLKPKVLIVLDAFRKNHALFRCFGVAIESLKDSFHITSLSVPGTTDDFALSIFDENIEFNIYDDRENVKEFIEKLRSEHFDVMYFPSVGQSALTCVLANIRVAAIQCCSFGMPSTTNCKFIDYGLIDHKTLQDSSLFAEKLVLKNEGAGFQFKEEYRDIKEASIARLEARKASKAESNNEINVSVLGTTPKLNFRLLETCREIDKRSSRKIVWHFFPDTTGLEFPVSQRWIQQYLPRAKVYPRRQFQEYLDLLAVSDLNLNAFPFGLSNGVVDLFMQGVPYIALYDKEMHSYLDTYFLKLVGLPDWLSCHSLEEYTDTALKLIEDDELRLQVSEQILSLDLENNPEFFANSPRLEEGANRYFCGLIEWIVANHHELQQSKDKTVDYPGP